MVGGEAGRCGGRRWVAAVWQGREEAGRRGGRRAGGGQQVVGRVFRGIPTGEKGLVAYWQDTEAYI